MILYNSERWLQVGENQTRRRPPDWERRQVVEKTARQNRHRPDARAVVHDGARGHRRLCLPPYRRRVGGAHRRAETMTASRRRRSEASPTIYRRKNYIAFIVRNKKNPIFVCRLADTISMSVIIYSIVIQMVRTVLWPVQPSSKPTTRWAIILSKLSQ